MRSSGRRTASRSAPHESAGSNRPAMRGPRRAPKACGADCPASSNGRSPEGRSTRRGPGLRRPAPKNPGQQLPVAPRPPVMANGADVVAGGEFLDDFDIRSEAGAREHALEEIVAEKRRVRRAARRARPRRRRRRRCPFRRRILRRTDPDRRRRRPRRRGRFRSRSRRSAGTASLRGRSAAKASREAARPRSPRRPGRPSRRGGAGSADAPSCRSGDAPHRAAVACPNQASRHNGRRSGQPGVPSPTSMKVVSVAPRSSRLSSWSLPRLRSQPIHRASPSFQTRRRCRRRKRVPPGAGP